MSFRPVVHKNGTSRDALLEQLTDLMQALRAAEDALSQASPNGRDYYPLGPNALRDAQNKHREWAVALRKIYQEVKQAAEHVAYQESARMIEIAKLEKMVQVEVAADKWWHDMTSKEKQAYLKAHPRSKYARVTKDMDISDTSKHGADKIAEHWRMSSSHEDATNKHERMFDKHAAAAKRHAANGNKVKAAAHTKAAKAHEKAMNAHSAAHEAHMFSGDHMNTGRKLSAFMKKAPQMSKSARAASRAAVDATENAKYAKSSSKKDVARRTSNKYLKGLFGDHLKG